MDFDRVPTALSVDTWTTSVTATATATATKRLMMTRSTPVTSVRLSGGPSTLARRGSSTTSTSRARRCSSARPAGMPG